MFGALLDPDEFTLRRPVSIFGCNWEKESGELAHEPYPWLVARRLAVRQLFGRKPR
jgi:hypothetical protein